MKKVIKRKKIKWMYVQYIVIGCLIGGGLFTLHAVQALKISLKPIIYVLPVALGGFLGYLLALIHKIIHNISICAVMDPVTQLSNRTRFNELLDREILRSNRHGTNLSLMLVDVDSFEKINDKFGSKIGDSVLMRVGSVVKAVSRDVDVCARWENDIFIVMLPDTHLEGARITAERLRSKVEDEFFPVVGQVTVSLGVTQFIPHKDLKETFIDRADNALYRVKKSGRNAVEVAEVTE